MQSSGIILSRIDLFPVEYQFGLQVATDDISIIAKALCSGLLCKTEAIFSFDEFIAVQFPISIDVQLPKDFLGPLRSGIL